MTYGGVTVVNALAAGLGAAAAVDLPLEARVTLDPDGPLTLEADDPEADPDPVLGAVRRVLAAHDRPDAGAEVVTESAIPVSRGLKSSSAATTAAALAADVAVAGSGPDRIGDEACLRHGVEASVAAGVSATGAWDDAYASLRGGVCVTDNEREQLLGRHRLPGDHEIALLIPPGTRATADAARRDHDPARRPARVAHDLAREGRIADAMAVNGLAYAPVYGQDPAPHLRAVEAGAEAASLSGTGPATAALCPPGTGKAVLDAWAAFEGETRLVDPIDEPAEVEPC